MDKVEKYYLESTKLIFTLSWVSITNHKIVSLNKLKMFYSQKN